MSLCAARRSCSALGIVEPTIFSSPHETGIDWNVIFLLFGMMIIVGVLRQTGVFEYIAIWAAKRAKGSPLRIMILLVLVTAFASALLDNVTTVLLIAPVTLLVCDRLAINPAPFLIAEVLASNIGGASTLVGDPPNIIIASRAGLTFNDFLIKCRRSCHRAWSSSCADPAYVSRIVSTSTGPSRRCDGAQRARGDPRSGPADQMRGGAVRGVRRVHRARCCTSTPRWWRCSAPVS